MSHGPSSKSASSAHQAAQTIKVVPKWTYNELHNGAGGGASLRLSHRPLYFLNLHISLLLCISCALYSAPLTSPGPIETINRVGSRWSVIVYIYVHIYPPIEWSSRTLPYVVVLLCYPSFMCWYVVLGAVSRASFVALFVVVF